MNSSRIFDTNVIVDVDVDIDINFNLIRFTQEPLDLARSMLSLSRSVL